jgi:O-antigen ligase
MLLFWFYNILRSLLSVNPTLSLESSLFYGRFIFFSLAVCYILINNQKVLLYFGISLWLCLAIITLDGYIQFFTSKNLLGWEQIEPLRVSGFFKEELILGSFISRLMPLGFFFIACLPHFKTKKIIVILSLLFLVALDVLTYLAGERLAFFNLIMGTVLIIFLVPDYRMLRISAFIISSIIIVYLSFSSPEIKSRMVDHTITQLGLDADSEKLNAFSPRYQTHYVSALKMFKNNPLFGQGPKLFRELCHKPEFYPQGCSTHPHQTYLQLLAETGIAGTLPVFLLLITVSYLLLKQFISIYFLKNNVFLSSSEACLLIAMMITLWPFAPSANFFTSWINAIYFLPVGFYLNEKNKKNKLMLKI